MKTNIIKSLAVGAVATVALFVSNAMADIGPLAITNWGFEPPYSGDTSSRIVEYPNIGAYELISVNHPNPNMGFKAALPLPYTLQNIGDKITIHYTMIFTNTGPNLEFVGGTVWRFFMGTTNNNSMGTLGPVASAGSPQWVGSGAARSSAGAYYLGYNFNFVAAGPGMPLALRQENANRIWLSTSGNVTTMGMAGTVGSSWPDAYHPNGAREGAYYVTVSAHLAETNLIILSYTLTNSDSVTNGPNSYSDIYSVTNYGCLFDDGNLGTRLQGQCPETKRFDVVGIYHSATAPYNNDVTYTNWTETISFNNPSPYTNVVLNNFNSSAQAGIWTNWLGASTNVGDLWSTLDSSALNDGSLEKVVTNWWAVFQTQSQTWTNWDQGLSPGLPQPGLNMLEFCADVMFDSSSTVVTNTANTNGFYGHLEMGLIDQFYSHKFQQFSNVTAAGVSPTVGYDFPATNPPNSWRHLNFYFDAWNSAYEGTLNNLAIAMNANFYTAAPLTNGSSTLYVDNMHLVELQSLDGVTVPFPTPTLNIECDRDLGLRIFTQPNATYYRSELVSQNSQMSWANNATYPVTYSFTVTNLPAPNQGLQTMFWFIPVGAMPTSDQVGGANGIGANDVTIDADATNVMCLEINNQTNPTNDDYHLFVGYKINTNGLSLNLGNPPVDYYATNDSSYVTNGTVITTNYWIRHVAYIKLATNYYNGNDMSKYFAASGNGTWTLAFSDATHGSITGPNLSPVTFTIPGGDEQYFLNPMQLYFGTQNNGVPGNSILLMNISINGAQGELTNDFAFGKNWSDDWRAVENGGARSTHLGLWQVPENIAYWLSWNTPAGGYDVEVAPYLTADPVYTYVPWVEPLFYVGFSPSTLTEQVEGRSVWTYITTNNLDSMMNYYPSVKSNAFFRLHRPPKSAR